MKINPQTFIKVLNPTKAQELIDQGFNYIIETVNGKIIHSFFVSKELLDYVCSRFSKEDYLLSNRLTY